MAKFYIEHNKDGDIAHQIVGEQIEETETGNGGTVFITACGQKKAAWHYGGKTPYTIYETGYLRQVAKDTAASLCRDCIKR